MIVDILIIFVLLLAILFGYLRGFYKEVYNLIAIVLASFGAYFSAIFLNTKFFSEISFAKLPDIINNLIIKNVVPALLFLILYLLLYFIIRIIIHILKKTNVIPSKKILRPVGAFINFCVTLFFLTFLALPISLTEIASDYEQYKMLDLYSNSIGTDILLNINPYAKNLNDTIKDGYYSVINLMTNMQDGEVTEDDLDNIKDLIKNTGIAEDVIVEISKKIFDEIDNNDIEINFEDVPIDEIEQAIKGNENYEMLKELYDDGIITDELIERIIEENNIKGLNPDDVIKIFN